MREAYEEDNLFHDVKMVALLGKAALFSHNKADLSKGFKSYSDAFDGIISHIPYIINDKIDINSDSFDEDDLIKIHSLVFKDNMSISDAQKLVMERKNATD